MNFHQPITTVSILIVEDSRSAAEIISRMVTMKFPDAVVYSADNGRTGLELFIKHSPVIVITDISMPEMDGIEMATKIKLINPDLTLIVFTGYSDADFMEQFDCIGVHTYLLKPFDLDELMFAVEKCIDKNGCISGCSDDNCCIFSNLTMKYDFAQ